MDPKALGRFLMQPSTADVLNTPIARGGIFPLTEYADRSEFDLTSGLPGAFYDALTAPARAYRGELPAGQQVPEAFNFAGNLTLGSLLAPRPTGSIGMGGRARAIEGQQSKGITGYQGSPHNFKAERLIEWPDGRTEYIEGMPDALPDIPEGAKVLKDFPLGRIRLDKIGTGEGAQAYGHGAYIAEAEDVARSYKSAGVPTGLIQYKGTGLSNISAGEYSKLAPITRQALNWLKAYDDIGRAAKDADFSDIPGLRREIERLSQSGDVHNYKDGHMYEVRINADPEDFLDWDKPLSQQSERVRGAFAGANPEGYDRFGHLALAAAKGEHPRDKTYMPSGSEAFSDLSSFGGRGDAEKALREAGITGIRYLDQGSRGAGEGSSNYVVFDDALIEILRKYGLLGPSAVGLAAASSGETPVY